MTVASMPASTSNHEITELLFHMSPPGRTLRPHVRRGTCETDSSIESAVLA